MRMVMQIAALEVDAGMYQFSNADLRSGRQEEQEEEDDGGFAEQRTQKVGMEARALEFAAHYAENAAGQVLEQLAFEGDAGSWTIAGIACTAMQWMLVGIMWGLWAPEWFLPTRSSSAETETDGVVSNSVDLD